MARYFKSVNKGSVQLDVFYGWDIDVKEWFIDIKMKGFSGGNLTQWFDSENNYKKTLKKVGVFIKNNTLRRKIDDDKRNLRNVKLKTVKNYLKTQNLIKYGSYAPNELLREIYDTSKLCGDINNINGSNLVHNFMSSDP